MNDPPPLSFTVEPTAQNHFAWVRTVMGLQRTHMAAVRTAVALIGFGFTVAAFLSGLTPAGMRAPLTHHGARDVGLLLIGAGVLSLAAFTLQYRRAVAYLRSAPFEAIAGRARGRVTTLPVYLTSSIVMGIGAAAFVSVLMRL